MVKFVSYNGKYPNLCSGELVVCINNEEVNFGCCLTSGGNVWFDNKWMEHVEEGEWIVSVPDEYREYEEEITDVVNASVPYGCCGGCI